MFLVSGSWWVMKRNVTSGGPAFDDSAELGSLRKQISFVVNVIILPRQARDKHMRKTQKRGRRVLLEDPSKAAMLVKMAHASNGSSDSAIWSDDQYLLRSINGFTTRRGSNFRPWGDRAGLNLTGSHTNVEWSRYDLATARQIWRGLSVELCHGHNGSQATLTAIFDQVRELGVSVASMDQVRRKNARPFHVKNVEKR
jgi:hypothetical protein